MSYFNFHTHQFMPLGKGISNYRIGIDEHVPPGYFSAGIHPWDVDTIDLPKALRALEHLLQHPRCVALGELGLDKACGVELSRQMQVFEQQIQLLNKGFPALVIIHSVKAMGEILKVKVACQKPLKWVLHGFNGNVQTAQQYLKCGFYLSIGAAVIHPQSKVRKALAAIDLDKLLIETDDSAHGIEEVYSIVAKEMAVDNEKIIKCIENNIRGLDLF